MNSEAGSSELICATIRDDFDEVCITISTQLLNLGFAEHEVLIGQFESCSITSELDDYDRQERILAEWQNSHGVRFASLVRYSDGNIFAEHDILLPHPKNADLFVEAIEVWGLAGNLKGEARLLAAL